jgi:hypothetical protein
VIFEYLDIYSYSTIKFTNNPVLMLSYSHIVVWLFCPINKLSVNFFINDKNKK